MTIDYLNKEQAILFGIEEDAENNQIVFQGERYY